MKRKVTIQDIANMVNVSKSSVSRYLNNGYVSEENAKKIKEAIEKTGFETNFFAKRLKTKRSRLIGIILPRINSFTVGHLLTGITRKLEENNYQGIILVSNLSIEKEISNISSLAQQGVDGIIVNSMAITEEHIKLINRLNIPTIFTGQKSDFTNYIKIDDYAAGRIMGDYFKDNNHKKVVFAGVDEKDIAVGIERKKGFIDAFKQDNEDSRVDFVKTSFSFENAYAKAEEILKYNPTGIVCATDNICLGILRYLHENNIKVPDDVSIAGFGGYDVGSVSYPTLTTVEFNYELIGEKTAEGILELIEGKNIKEDSKVSLKLVERESVKRI
ncbi:MAG: LacI family DNA-binding transcriptional regulator [Clostridium sp.]|nr:LacI family DNA-binding transcriptional regulator [Clostridium sp.]